MSDDFENELGNPAEPEELVFLGRVLGTCSGWDGDLDAIGFYDFNPAPGVSLPAGSSLSININTGEWSIENDEGSALQRGDIIETLAKLPRSSKS